MKRASLAVLCCFGIGCVSESVPSDRVDVGSSDVASSARTPAPVSMSVSRTADREASGSRKSTDAACADDAGSCAILAAFDDGFVVPTTDDCGRADFIDFGPGAAGGGDNDDYVEIHDFCSDGHGVIASGTLTKRTTVGDLTFDLGSRYNGNGLNGNSVIWDPFKPLGNVDPNDTVVLKACLVDGPNGKPFKCQVGIWTSIDG